MQTKRRSDLVNRMKHCYKIRVYAMFQLMYTGKYWPAHFLFTLPGDSPPPPPPHNLILEKNFFFFIFFY